MPEPDLDVAADERFQRRGWLFQRAGWIGLALCIVAALAGAFGDGPLARGEERSADGKFGIAFERIARRHAPNVLSVRWEARGDAPPQVWIARSYLDDVEVKEVEPAPARVVAQPERLVYEFEAGTVVPATFRFTFEPCKCGMHTCDVGTPGGSTVSFRQFVFP